MPSKESFLLPDFPFSDQLLPVAALQGPFLSFALEAERAVYSIAYCISFTGVLFSSLVWKAYFVTIVLVIAQMVSMSYIILSYVPGGTRFLTMVLSMFMGVFRTCCRSCFGGSGGGGGSGGLLG